MIMPLNVNIIIFPLPMDETIADAKKVSSDPMRVAKVTLCKSTNDEYLIIPEYVLKSLNEITKKKSRSRASRAKSAIN
jgi:hypothetical protein